MTVADVLRIARDADGEWARLPERFVFGDFRESALCISGLVCRSDAGNTYLIGDVNQRGGQCECCDMVTREGVITHVRWAMRPAPSGALS